MLGVKEPIRRIEIELINGIPDIRINSLRVDMSQFGEATEIQFGVKVTNKNDNVIYCKRIEVEPIELDT